MEQDQYDWRRDPKVLLPVVLLVLSPGIVKIILSILGAIVH